MRAAPAAARIIIARVLLQFEWGGGGVGAVGPSSSLLLLQPRPLHSSPNDGGGWNCHVGFFRTVPPRWPAHSTCRPCTPLIQRPEDQVAEGFLACPLGTGVVPCTPDADADCARCPPLPPGYRHTGGGGDCLRSSCSADGYYYYYHYNDDGSQNGTGNACRPCPLGLYCSEGIAAPCGSNCSTETVRAPPPLLRQS